MEKLILMLYREPRYGYEDTDCEGQNIRHLSVFLTDIKDYVSGFQEWALNPDDDFSYTEQTELDKESDEIVITAEGIDDETEFRITIDQFVQMLDEWKNLQRQRPKRIIISQVGEEVFVDGEEFPDPPYIFFKDEYLPKEIISLKEGCFALRWEKNKYRSFGKPQELWHGFITFIHFDFQWYGVDCYREWLQGEKEKILGDICFLAKKEGYIIIKDGLDLRDPEVYFALTYAQFEKFLDDWENIYKDSPPYIFVQCDDGNISLTPMDKDSVT